MGAGPAGLAATTALTDRGVEHVVLERAWVGETWRTQRWDSFRLNTPGWMNELLGEKQPAGLTPRHGLSPRRLLKRAWALEIALGESRATHARVVTPGSALAHRDSHA